MEGVRALLQSLLPLPGFSSGPKAGEQGSHFFSARIISCSGDLAVLRGGEKQFNALLRVPVQAGEVLLLRRAGQTGGLSRYRIVERLPAGVPPEPPAGGEERRELPCAAFFVKGAGDRKPAAALVRGSLPRRLPGGVHGSGAALELLVETENIGLVLVRLSLNSAGLHCRFEVESEAAGHALEEEARRILDRSGPCRDDEERLLAWSVRDLRLEAARLSGGGFGIDREA